MSSKVTRAKKGEGSNSGQGKSDKKHAIYDVISEGVRDEMTLCGYRVHPNKTINKDKPYLTVSEVRFPAGRKKAFTVDVHVGLGRWCPGVTWTFGDHEFTVLEQNKLRLDDTKNPQLRQEHAGKEMTVEESDDGSIVVFRPAGKGKKEFAVTKLSDLRCESHLDITGPMIVINDKWKTICTPGTGRFRPIPGKVYPVVTYYVYFNAQRTVMRYAKMFPLYPEELSAEEYAPAPTDDKPYKTDVTFLPVWFVGKKGDQKREVRAYAIDSQGKAFRVHNEFPLEDNEYGVPVHGMVIESRYEFVFIPDRIPEGASEEEKSEANKKVGSAIDEYKQKEINLEDDEFAHLGQKLNIYESLATWGVTPDSILDEVDKAYKKMSMAMHEDTSPKLAPFKKMNVSPPPALVKQLNSQLATYQAAFTRLQVVLRERAELQNRAVPEGGGDEGGGSGESEEIEAAPAADASKEKSKKKTTKKKATRRRKKKDDGESASPAK